jgi:hypothetical protein
VNATNLTLLPLGLRARLLLIGLGVGVMQTPSVNVVQSAFPEESRARSPACLAPSRIWVGPPARPSLARSLVSNLGDKSYAASMIALACISMIGLVATLFLPGSACSLRRVRIDRVKL